MCSALGDVRFTPESDRKSGHALVPKSIDERQYPIRCVSQYTAPNKVTLQPLNFSYQLSVTPPFHSIRPDDLPAEWSRQHLILGFTPQ